MPRLYVRMRGGLEVAFEGQVQGRLLQVSQMPPWERPPLGGFV